MLELARAIQEQPKEEYPAGFYSDEFVVWQLSELYEGRAADELNRIIGFSAHLSAGRFGRPRESLVAAAKQTLEKLDR